MGLMCFAMLGAANTNDTLSAYQAQGVLEASRITSTQLNALKATSEKTQSDNKSLIDTLMQGATKGLQRKQQPQGVDGAVLFVSFSMPESLLLALADEAATFDIPVVINGLVEGDFKKTIEVFKHINSEAKAKGLHVEGLSIDPLWFSQFQIKSVPALVVSPKPKSCSNKSACTNQPFDVVYGNTNLKQSLELIVRKGEAASETAQSILEQAHA